MERPTLDIRSHLGGLGCQPLADICLQLLLDNVVGEGDVVPHVGIGDGELEGVDRVSVLLVERPANVLVEVLDRCAGLLGDVAHDGVHHLGLVVPLLALDDILGRYTALRQIDITLVLVHTQHDHDFVAANTDKLLDRTDTSSRQFGEQDHAVDVVCDGQPCPALHSSLPLLPTVFEELDVGAHLRNLLHVHHDEALHLGVLLLVKPTVCERHDCGWLRRTEACDNREVVKRCNGGVWGGPGGAR